MTPAASFFLLFFESEPLSLSGGPSGAAAGAGASGDGGRASSGGASASLLNPQWSGAFGGLSSGTCAKVALVNITSSLVDTKSSAERLTRTPGVAKLEIINRTANIVSLFISSRLLIGPKKCSCSESFR